MFTHKSVSEGTNAKVERPGGKCPEPILGGLCGSVWVSGLYLNALDLDIDLEVVLILQASLGMGSF